MDFVANGSKNVEIETSTGVYLRHAIQTHFVEIGEDYIELVNRYVKPLYEEGDLLSISEKIIALCQKRVVYRKDMKISWLAKFLSRFAIQHNSAGIGVGEVCKMQFAIDECGAWKVLWAAICAGFGKLVGKHGIFYDMVGMEVTGLDGLTPAQRFYLSYATVWAQNIRDEEIARLTKLDVHSLGQWRVDATLRNLQDFFDAFNITDGKMYMPVEERVIIW